MLVETLSKAFDPLGRLVPLTAGCFHIPEKGESRINCGIRYYGYCSNVSRGRREKENRDALIPSILEADEDSKAYRKNWARLIQKTHPVK